MPIFARFFETLKKIRIRENVPDGCIQDKYLEKKMLDFLENKGYTISAENI